MPRAPAPIKDSPEYQRIARSGKRWSCDSFLIQAVKGGEGVPLRYGLTASRKTGNAVVRNRAKRRLREMVRLTCRAQDIGNAEIVLIAKPAAAQHDFAAMKQDFLRGLRALGVLA